MHESLRDAADLRSCRAMMRGGSRSFFAASLLLPRRVHEPAAALYAFCRLADDAIDEGEIDGGACQGAALLGLRERLERAYAGRPLDCPADRAFAAVVARHRVPRTLPEALLEGFEWDACGRRYETMAELHDYAARVAGTVGAMMAVLMGVRSRPALARACDLGVAMQLTNIARDVGEDARAGRLYLPLAWLRAEGIDPAAWLAAPAFTPAVGRVVRRLLEEAATLYARAASGVALLPADCRPGIRAAERIYAAIGQRIAARGFDSVGARARVPGGRKAVLMLRSLGALLPDAAEARAPVLDAVRYLVDAAACEMPARTRGFSPWRAVDKRVTWMFDLLERLEQRPMESP